MQIASADRPGKYHRFMPNRRRTLSILAASLAFGILAAWLKGPNGDGVSGIAQLRSDVGNISTPWLLVAFIPGTMAIRPRAGALIGLLATATALFGFYVFTSFLVDLGGHGALGNLLRELRANRIYLGAGALSGPIFGALGAWWRSRRSVGATLVAGALLIGEPIVLTGIGILVPATVVGRNGVAMGVYVAEFALGLLLLWLGRRLDGSASRAH